MEGARQHVREMVEFQARSCRELGSPLYGTLLEAAAREVGGDGAVWRILEPYAADPEGSALALRFMAAVHRLVLRGQASALADFYPSAGGSRGPDGAAETFLTTVAEHEDGLRRDTAAPLQTNEVGRSAALVGGFLTVAQRFDVPLNVLEVGASAGLNLRWDRYLYEARGATWGDPSSPVRLCSYNTEALPPFDVSATVARRRGCDPAPIDPTTEEGATRLLSFVWPDQVARIRLLRGAIEVARRVPAEVDEAPASAWLRSELSQSRPGEATVVFHSIVLQYMDDEERAAFDAVLAEAGRRATEPAPLTYLRMEPNEEEARYVEVRLTTWPGGRDELLAHSGYHGTAVRWLARG